MEAFTTANNKKRKEKAQIQVLLLEKQNPIPNILKNIIIVPDSKIVNRPYKHVNRICHRPRSDIRLF
jgi:hypothetical protein